MKTIIKALMAILCLLAVLMIACVVWYRVSNRPDPLSGGPVSPEPAGDKEAGFDREALLAECAGDALEGRYAEYLPEVLCAETEVFDTQKTGDEAVEYVILDTGEYVLFKDRLYLMSGGSGEAIIRYSLPDGRLKEVEWSEDGAGHEKWVREHFTAKALQARNAYLKGEDSGRTRLGRKLDAKAEKLLGAPVETENLLNIDTDKGTYELIETLESGDTPDTYKFDTRVLEEGTLKN
ncbi:MAG: hypothetical protein IJT95_06145 [Abditibacteriota bacterium]|nr:hypothetical protein [Abditibacteriota bacterium]